MVLKKWISSLLTGASIATLSIAAIGRAAAGTTVTATGGVPFTVPANFDWVNVHGADLSSFTNGRTISDGSGNPDTSLVPQNRNALAVHVDSGSLISIFLNAAAGKITASSFGRTTTGGSFKATATGLLSNGQIPKLTNNGSIKAFASAEFSTVLDATAQAYAEGLILNPPAGANVMSAVTNNGSISATAFAKASAETDAGARASATAASQIATGTGAGSKATLSLTNSSTGVIGAKATAVASATYHAASAHAFASGAFQVAEEATTETLSLANAGTISADAKATAKLRFGTYAEANATATGAFQRAEGLLGGTASLTVTNSKTGVISAKATALASATYNSAEARAFARGVGQNAEGATTATISLTNAGTISAAAKATANLRFGTYAEAVATAHGVDQFADTIGGGTASLTLTNSKTGVISAKATALASGTYVHSIGAAAFARGVSQSAEGFNTETLSVTNAGKISVAAKANANVVFGTYVTAGASALGVRQHADGIGSGSSSSATLVNTGSIVVASSAGAHTQFGEYAFAFDEARGVYQGAFDAQKGTVSLTNMKLISASASASAGAHLGFANADARGVQQSASGDGFSNGVAKSILTNTGTISAHAKAVANGTYEAIAGGRATGVEQEAYDAGSASVTLTNSGAITADLSVTAMPRTVSQHGGEAFTTYVTAAGVRQYASGDEIANSKATVGLTNSGKITANAVVKGSGTYAEANGGAVGVWQQVREATVGSASVTNSGLISATDTVTASAGHGAEAIALGPVTQFGVLPVAGVAQQVGTYASTPSPNKLTASVANSGKILANVNATAGGHLARSATYAEAAAFGAGVFQELQNGTNETASVTNSGLIQAVVNATASAEFGAEAEARAAGIEQEFDFPVDGGNETSSILNTATGVINATANAKTLGGLFGEANATAAGVAITDVGPSDAVRLHLDVINDGVIKAVANASAGTYEHAQAVGIGVFSDGSLDGRIRNTGTITARAFAPDGFAEATGIVERSLVNNGRIVNTGLIHAYAQGSEAESFGIRLEGEDGTGEDGLATITNKGKIWAGRSEDGGKTILWGNAIDTTDAPNPVLIQLEDPVLQVGQIFGNINISPDDTIHVLHGETILDGDINSTGDMVGSLDILSDGKLLLGNQDPVNGPSNVWIDSFTLQNGGILGLELKTANALPGVDYSQINANTVALHGTVAVNYLAGIYQDHQVYKDVIVAGLLTGAFDASGNYTKVADNSALLNTRVIRDPSNSNDVDIIANRVAFSAAQGLSGNEKSVGESLDQLFGTGKLSKIFPQLFALNSSDYAKALNALSGAEFAQLDQSVLWSTGQLNSTITDRMDCDSNWAASAQGIENKRCFVPGKTQVWARIDGSWNHDSGDSNAPGYGESQYAVYGGADYAFTNDTFVGLAAGYFSSDMSFDDWTGMGGSSINYSGLQAAGYGGYDDGRFYARGIGSFGVYTGDSHRQFGLTGSPLDPSGSFDASVESFYGEMGRRYTMMPQTTVTPFLGVSIAHSDVGGFTESDPNNTGAALKVGDGSGNSLASVVGGRIEGHWGAWRPEVSVAWQHEFMDPVLSVNNAFASAPGVGFTVDSSDPGRDWALVSLGTTYDINPSNQIVLKYDGRFASGYSSSSVVARWDVHF